MRGARRWTVAVLVVLSVLGGSAACLTPPVSAAVTHLYTDTSFGPGGVGSGTFFNLQSVAVDQSTGDVYAYDAGEGGSIYKFDAAGDPVDFSGLSGNAITGVGGAGNGENEIAVDSSSGPDQGDIYAANNHVVRIYSSAGSFLGELNGGEACGVAVDPAGNVYVGFYSETVRKYIPVSNPVSNVDESASMGGLNDICNIAVDGEGSLYAATFFGGVRRYDASQFGSLAATGTLVDEHGSTLAADPVTDDLYVDEGPNIAQYDSSGDLIDGSGAGVISESHGVAVRGGVGGDLYASDGGGRVAIFGPAVVVADAMTQAASGVGSTTATLNGSVNPDNTAVSACEFEYGTEEGVYGNTAACSQTLPLTGDSPVAISAQITGLEANGTYHYRIVATNENGTSHGPDETFTTLPVPPEINGVPGVSSVTRSSAVVQATVNPKHDSTSYHFLYVEDAEYEPAAEDPYAAGGSGEPSDAGAGSGAGVVEQVLNGLKPDTTYDYTVVAINAAGRVTGTNATFTTDAGTPPAAVTGGASGVAQNGATIAGTLNTSGLPTAYGFEVGTSTDYGPPTGLGSVGAGSSEAQVSLALTGLQPGTIYHYRLTATNVDGTSYGVDQTFTTGTFANTFAVPPAPLPFVAVPAIAFPLESAGSSTTTPKALTKAQKLAAALKACHKKAKAKRGGCEKQARKRYGSVKRKKR